MANTNIYEELDNLKTDIKTLQIAFSLLAQKLYPSVKIDSEFWDEVHRTRDKMNETKPVE